MAAPEGHVTRKRAAGCYWECATRGKRRMPVDKVFQLIQEWLLSSRKQG
jgi:hypothetical protein